MLDVATADQFSARTERLLAEGYEHLVLDLRQLTFMDSISSEDRDAAGSETAQRG